MTSTSTIKLCYADCFSGISGDMLLGAFIHSGLDQQFLRNELDKLSLGDFDFTTEEKTDQGITGCKVTICSKRRQELRTLPSLLDILAKSDLDETITSRSAEVFQTIARAEAKVHGIDINKVHFHEVGALDTIVDVVGTVIALHALNIERVISSPLPMGRGFINCAHGKLPLPAPAVCEIVKNAPVYGVEIAQELVTPTGAALITTLADEFGPIPSMTVSSTGYGAGTHTLPDNQPNLLRIITGFSQRVAESQIIEIIETNLDDWSPEGFPFICERLFEKGALDVSLTSILMKKGRPGFTLQVICTPARSPELKNTILTETSTIGLRFRREQRLTLARKEVSLATSWGEIKAKEVQTPHGPVIYPEYEECKKIATRHSIPLQEVYNEVRCMQRSKE